MLVENEIEDSTPVLSIQVVIEMSWVEDWRRHLARPRLDEDHEEQQASQVRESCSLELEGEEQAWHSHAEAAEEEEPIEVRTAYCLISSDY
jgi:hypothetical protein